MSALPDLECSNLHVALGGREILRGISLSLKPGAITAVLGPNGAGKSTLLRSLSGLIRPAGGQVHLGGRDISLMDARARARVIGYLPQTPTIAWAVDVATLVGLGRTPHLGAFGPGAPDHAAIAEAISACNLDEFRHRDVTTLSGGERARVLIARVLAGKPAWLLTDEPLGGLDPGHRLDVIALFRAVADTGCGVAITLHDLDTAVRLADRIVIVSDGRILADGPPALALTPDSLARAYGINARVIQGASGPIIDVTGRADRTNSG